MTIVSALMILFLMVAVYTTKLCNDSDYCTDDSCDATGCANTVRNCDNENACTIDWFLQYQKQMFKCFNQFRWQERIFALMTAVIITGCKFTTKSCDDLDTCTTDSCDESSGCCIHIPVKCDDKSACTTDSCSGGSCVNTPISCDDHNICISDKCNTQTGCCHSELPCAARNCYTSSCDEVNGCQYKAIMCDDYDLCNDVSMYLLSVMITMLAQLMVVTQPQIPDVTTPWTVTIITYDVCENGVWHGIGKILWEYPLNWWTACWMAQKWVNFSMCPFSCWLLLIKDSCCQL